MQYLTSLIQYTLPDTIPKEDVDDVYEVNCGHNNQPGCIACRICKTKSGTHRTLWHRIGCKYSSYNSTMLPSTSLRFATLSGVVLDDVPHAAISMGVALHTRPIDPSTVKCVYQREYSICMPTVTKPTTLSSFGAGPCIILCMRDTRNGDTMLAHIDSMTLHPLETFSGMFHDCQEHVEVYMVGGDSTSVKDVHLLLTRLRDYSFIHLKLMHLLDSYSNNFAIHCETGETYLNFPLLQLGQQNWAMPDPSILFSRSRLLNR
jgi:hypothetical protein